MHQAKIAIVEDELIIASYIKSILEELNYIVPDYVHVLSNGRIVKSGGKELALELEDKGYVWLEETPAAAGSV